MAARLSSALLRTQPDRRLAALAADGSEPAFEALVERYRKPLQAYCRRLLIPQETAEDVVQQAMLSTWQALGRGTDIANVRAWLYRVTHNEALNALRRSGYRFEELSDALRGGDAPEEELERRIAVRQALAGLAALPEQQREALLRTALEGHSHEDVARDLGLTDGAVRGLVYRARATLRTAAGAITPSPVLVWAASAGSRGAPVAERIGELIAGGGSAGAAALLAKGGAAAVVTAGALAGGAVAVKHDPAPQRAAAPQVAERGAVHRTPAVAERPATITVRATGAGPARRHTNPVAGRGKTAARASRPGPLPRRPLPPHAVRHPLRPVSAGGPPGARKDAPRPRPDARGTSRPGAGRTAPRPDGRRTSRPIGARPAAPRPRPQPGSTAPEPARPAPAPAPPATPAYPKPAPADTAPADGAGPRPATDRPAVSAPSPPAGARAAFPGGS